MGVSLTKKQSDQSDATLLPQGQPVSAAGERRLEHILSPGDSPLRLLTPGSRPRAAGCL